MAGGLAIASASSAAWSEMGAQAERALNTGWILDQRQDGAGGFITNCSPLSAPGGLTSFLSTGDATAFYLIGRAVKVVQTVSTTTAICTVGQSSFAAGVTTIFINQFSTAGSTVLSTGVITNVSASPLVAGGTGNTFGGGTIFPATGGNPGLAVGFNAASAGSLRLPNNTYIWWRETANGFDSGAIGIGPTGSILFLDAGSANRATISTGGLVNATLGFSVGALPGTVGSVRVPASTSNVVVQRNPANTADEQLLPLQYGWANLATDVTMNTTALFDGPSVALSCGTWCFQARFQLGTNSAAPVGFYGRLWDGTTIKTVGEVTLASTFMSDGCELNLGVIAQTCAATWKISAVATNGNAFMRANSTGVGIASTGSTWIQAIRLGQ